jgi:hypothetical protein
MVKLEGRHSTVNLPVTIAHELQGDCAKSNIRSDADWRTPKARRGTLTGSQKQKENNRFLSYSTRGGNIRGN